METAMIRSVWVAVFAAVLVCAFVRPAAALPVFAHEYGFICQKCHTEIPNLTPFGRAFLANGFRLPGASPGSTFPIATRVNLAYSSAPDPGLPKAVVDEVELLTGGVIGSRTSYFVEQYVLDGGLHGSLREAWASYRLTNFGASIPVSVRAGQFTLSLPVDPETFRESASHYAVYDQTVGNNTFNFFDPKVGISARIGKYDHGTSIEVSALNGHDVQNGLPTVGVDTLTSIHHVMGGLDLSAYQYQGRRNVDPGAPADGGIADLDRFTRTGVGLRYQAGRWTSESVLQENTDTNADGLGTSLRTSGGFTQLRYAISPKLFTLVRQDGTNDTEGFSRATTALFGIRFGHNSRFTIEDVITHTPAAVHTLNTQYTIAY
jgi:hypothetical protein